MKRVVLAVPDPWNYLDRFPDYSMAIVNPASTLGRKKYLLDNLDWSLMVTPQGEYYQDGGDYQNESIVMYTSGTTGDSKFYSYSQQQVDYVISNIITTYSLTANDRFLSIMPLWHGHGHVMNLVARKLGMDIRVAKIDEFRSQIDFGPTWISAIPDVLKLLCQTQVFNDLRFIRSASSALSTRTFQDLKTKFQVPIIEAFGMSEACSHCFTNPLYGEQRIGTVGLPDGVEAEIRDSVLWIKGLQCYTDQWFSTGDLVDQDSAGYYRIIGRQLDRLVIHGIKLDPLSIENQLYNRFDELAEVVVFGDNSLMCVYTGNITADQIKKALSEIGTYCTPRVLKQVGAIPKNNAGKVSRTLLTEMYK